MFYSLDELRKKPKSTRQQILLISTTTITLIIFVLWLSSLGGPSMTKKEKQIDSDSQNPFSLIKDRVNVFYEEAKGQIDNN